MPNKEFETARYLELGGERIYAISYACKAPKAWVLFCGPFPSDRLYSLAACAKWARFLARSSISAVRFDYSGTGESSGCFSEMDFERWIRDIEGMCNWVSTQSGDLPIILHGLGMGALLAQKVFSSGRADGLLMWSPPLHGIEILQQGLTIRLSMDMLLYHVSERRSASYYIQELKTGRPVQIDGYAWSSALWSTGENLSLDLSFVAPGEGKEEKSGRFWQHVELDDHLSPLVKSQHILRAMNPRAAIVPSVVLSRDFGDFFEHNVSWIRRNSQCHKVNLPRA